MPLFDMPLEKLPSYEGRNPKPDDFDAYWDKALEEMRATDPEVTLEPADFQTPFADCFDMTFTGVGGARVYAKLLKPKNPTTTPHPAIVEFHGYSGNSGEWTGKLSFAALGFTVASMDVRGQGGRSHDSGMVLGNTLRGHIIRGIDDAPEKMFYRQAYLDTAMLTRIVAEMDDVDADRIGAMGGSQGGGLTLACASLAPIRRAAPRCPFLCDYQRVWELDMAKDAYAELTDYFRRFDPTHAREKEIFTRLGYIDCQHLAPRIQGEVLMATGLMDTVCPPSTQFAAFNRIPGKKEVVIYPDFKHENYPGFDDKAFQFLAGLVDL